VKLKGKHKRVTKRRYVVTNKLILPSATHW